jgi:hypothetical protein
MVALAGEPMALWPKSIDTPQGRCTVFQPQPAALDGDQLSARSALAIAPNDSTNVVFGIAQLQARAVQEPDGKQTTLSEFTLTQTTFAPANAAAMAGLADTLKPELAKVTWTMPSEELKAGLDAVERERATARGINTAPPRILYSSKPAVLIVLDGAPQLRVLTNSPLMRVVNTPYAMVFDPTEKRYWLRGSFEWFSASDWRGEWTAVTQPPAPVAAAVPKEEPTNAPTVGSLTSGSPRIVVVTEPTELVVTRGEAVYSPVAGSDLLYVSNSDQLLFFTIDTKEFYVALSGRWYRSPALTGPWDPVASNQLPPVFAKMNAGSPKSEALTYVAGTVEAQDAVAQASIPQITAVERGPANVEVKYDGAPQFQPVENTGVQYAANTVDAVFLVRGNYYMCRDAVWYTGTGPDGPWSVAAWVPSEIQSLPPTNPHYNVKYVYVYGATPEEVYVGYVPGYSGCYVYGPTVVYGTGWWYPGYYGPAYCWAYPATFGFGFGYSSWSGWSVGVGFGYGWLGCGYGWGWGGYYPWGWWGPCGAYWACAPRYPCYDGHHHGGGGPGAHYGHAGGGGRPPGPPPGGSRSEMRKDAPGPWGQPANQQRRALPSYARTARSSAPPSTALRSSRALESRPTMGGAPSRVAQPTRTETINRSGAMPSRNAVNSGGGGAVPTRSATQASPGGAPRTEPRTATSQPSRSTELRTGNAPVQSAPSSTRTVAPNQPNRVSTTPRSTTPQASPATPSRAPSSPASSWPGARPSTPGPRSAAPTGPTVAPTARSPAVQAAPVYSRTSVSAPSSVQSSPGAMTSYGSSTPRSAMRAPSFSSSPVYRSGSANTAMPSYASPSRSTMSAPASSVRGGGFSGYSAPTRGGFSSGGSAPMRSAPMGSSGGSGSRGAPTRGR